MKDKKSQILRYSILFLLLAALCWLFPYTGDDWAWGSEIGLQRLDVWFYKYNGRYLGNLLVLLMTRSNLIKSLIMSLCLTATIFFAEKISQNKWGFYVFCLAMILLPKEIFMQSIVWTAGFTNYVAPIPIILGYIAYVYPVLTGVLPKKKYWHCVPLLLAGFCSTLFMEHVTIYVVVLAAGVIVYTLIRFRKVFVQQLSFLLGSVVGAFCMFSNGAYHAVANSEDSYRTMGGNVLECALNNYKTVIVEQLCLNNVWVNLMIAAVCCVVFYYCQKTIENKKWIITLKGSLLMICFYTFWSFFSAIGLSTAAKRGRVEYFEAGLTVLFIIAILVFTLCIGIQCDCLWKLLFWDCSILCLTLPLLVVTPIGPRCFFPTYVMFVLLFMELYCQVPAVFTERLEKAKILERGCLFVCGVGMIFYFNIFSSIAQVDRARLAHIKKDMAQGKTKVEIIHLPYESYVWTATPQQEPWFERYKLFHQLPEDLTLVPVWKYGDSKK